MEKIIRFGFLPIQEDFLRPTALAHGKQLFEANHVSNVEEKQRPDEPPYITGNVLPTNRINAAAWAVKLILDNHRKVTTGTYCTCEAGQGMCCKHIAAVIHYINSTKSSTSKTDEAQKWGKPSKKKDIYLKGIRIAELFPKKTKTVHPAKITPVDFFNVDLPFHCALKPLIASEKITEAERQAKKLAIERANQSKRIEIESIAREITNRESQYCIFKCNENLMSEDVSNFYVNNIVLNTEEIIDVAFVTLEQSNCAEWFHIRQMRLSASRAHAAKTRRTNFDKLAVTLYQVKKVETAATSYGIKMEQAAFTQYNQIVHMYGWTIKQIGVVVKSSQPWLCSSPDGIVKCPDNQMRLLEIKCPFKCKNIPIIDVQNSTSNVSYLVVNENNEFKLKENHQYYTQIQLSMYCTNIAVTDLFIYSPMGHVLLQVERSNMFLSKIVLKLELFYFKYYLPMLKKKV